MKGYAPCLRKLYQREIDGLFINLQGKNREKVLKKQKGPEDDEFSKSVKAQKELKLHIMYEGWKKGDNRHSLINKVYTSRIIAAKELKQIRDAKVYEKYNEDTIKLRILNGDGVAWTRALTPKGRIYQKDFFHIVKKVNDCVPEGYTKKIMQLITTKASYKKIYNELEKIKYEGRGVYEEVKK